MIFICFLLHDVDNPFTHHCKSHKNKLVLKEERLFSFLSQRKRDQMGSNV